MTNPTPFAPLTEDEEIYLEEFLEEHARLDIEGTLGLFHAVAVAPGMIAPRTWLETLFPPDAFANADEAGKVFGLAMRLYNEVIQAVQTGEPMTPEADAIEACASFARGFMAGVLADPEWAEDEERYKLAVWAAMLALDPALDESVEPAPNEDDIAELRPQMRLELDSLILEAYETFLPLRGAPPKPKPAKRAVNVGRNDRPALHDHVTEQLLPPPALTEGFHELEHALAECGTLFESR